MTTNSCNILLVMRGQSKWKTLTCTWLLAVALAVGVVPPADAIILQAVESVGDQWSNVMIPDGEQSDPPFTISGESHGVGPEASLDIVIDVFPTPDGSNSFSFDVTTTNLSGERWYRYAFGLGYGTGPDFVYATGAMSTLFIDPTMTPMSSVFPLFDLTSPGHPHAATFYDGGHSVMPGGVVNFTFGIHAEGMQTFTLRQFAISDVPEPTTVVLMGLGLAGLGFTRRRMKA